MPPDYSAPRRDLIRCLVSAALAAALFVLLCWLLWKYVPASVARFEGTGAPLPGDTRVVVACSVWFVRLLPFGILVVPPVATAVLIILFVIAWRTRAWATLLKALGVAFLVVSLAEALAAAFVLRAMRHPQDRAGLQATPTRGRWAVAPMRDPGARL